jgi:hypothetical protein
MGSSARNQIDMEIRLESALLRQVAIDTLPVLREVRP